MDLIAMQKEAGRGFIPELEATRGIAALVVAAYHISQAPILIDGATQILLHGPDTEGLIGTMLRKLYRLLASGHGDVITPSVLYFFVLSGFVLARSTKDRWSNTPRAWAAFVIGRVFRLYPAIVTTIALFTLLFLLTGRGLAPPSSYAIPNIISNMALWHVDIDGVTWSLQAEVVAIPFLMVLFTAYRRFGLAAPCLITLVCIGLIFSRWWRDLLPWPQAHLWMYAFGIGAIAAYLRPRLSWRANRAMAWAAIVVLFAVPAMRIGSGSFRMISEALAAAALIVALSSGGVGALTTVLRTRILRFFGRISYSFYLLHPLTLTIAWTMPQTLGSLVEHGVPTAILSFALWLVSVAAIAPLAWLSYRFVEMPAHAWGTALRQRVLQRQPAARDQPVLAETGVRN